MGVTLGPLLRQCFVERKTALLRKHYRPNPRYDSPEFWTKVGDLCFELNAAPNQFMTALFEESREKQGPFPNALCGAWARRAWAFWSAKNKQSVVAANGNMRLDTSELDGALTGALSDIIRLFGGNVEAGALSATMVCPPYLRLLLAPDSVEVWDAWESQGLPDLQSSPDLVRQAASKNLPVAKVLKGHPRTRS